MRHAFLGWIIAALLAGCGESAHRLDKPDKYAPQPDASDRVTTSDGQDDQSRKVRKLDKR